MSFKINWPEFSHEFIDKAKEQLTVALNKGKKPENIVDRIEVKELDMGTKVRLPTDGGPSGAATYTAPQAIRPPDLEILEISELSEDRFKGIFKLVYTGDAFIIIKTRVQANPLTTAARQRTVNPRLGMLAAQRPFVVPMEIRISNVRLRGIIVLVVDQEKGITLVFKNDPLERVDVNSTFDNIPNIRRFLQTQIEGQLRNLFQTDLPQMVHNLSLMLLHQKAEAARPRSSYSSDTYSRRDSYSSHYSHGYGPSGGMGDPRYGSGGPHAHRGHHGGGHPYGDMGGSAAGRHSHYDSGHYGAGGDGGYMGDGHRRDGRSPSRSGRSIPHQQKWSGNEPVETDGYASDQESSGNGYVLYRSLSQTGIPESPELGLNHLFLHETTPRKPRITSRLGPGDKASVGDAPGSSARSVSAASDSRSMASAPATLSGTTVFGSGTAGFGMPGGSRSSFNANVQHHYPPHLAPGSTAVIGLSGVYRSQGAYGRPLFSPPPSSTLDIPDPADQRAGDTLSALDGSNVETQQLPPQMLPQGRPSLAPSFSAASDKSGVAESEDAASVRSSPAGMGETVYMYRQGQVQNGTVWHRPVQELDRQYLAPPPRFPMSRRGPSSSGSLPGYPAQHHQHHHDQQQGSRGSAYGPGSPRQQLSYQQQRQMQDEQLHHQQMQQQRQQFAQPPSLQYRRHQLQQQMQHQHEHLHMQSHDYQGDPYQDSQRYSPSPSPSPRQSHVAQSDRHSHSGPTQLAYAHQQHGHHSQSQSHHHHHHHHHHGSHSQQSRASSPTHSRYGRGYSPEPDGLHGSFTESGHRLFEPEMPSRVVLQPSDNGVAAHLANLMNSNHTISPHTHDLEHYTYRAAAATYMMGSPAAAAAAAAAAAVGGGSGGASSSGNAGNGITSPTGSYAPSFSGDQLETRSMSGYSATSSGFSYGRPRHVKRKAVARTVRTIRIPNDIVVPGLSRAGSQAREGGLGSDSGGASSSLDQ
ncbi:ERMES complex subunit [Polyrhizophydium stewartii]|uniref:Mitochondrial distribution and morphology protein 34 n=1 Tax=Polyrhizophydium stewartii TaxID=2732419 RepID=A0ABR4NE46_9FUNG